MKRTILSVLATFFAVTIFAQLPTTGNNSIYIETPIYAKSETVSDQTTFAAMRPYLVQKVNENPKTQAVEDRNCTYKLLTVIQNYKQYIYRDSVSKKSYFKVEFYYVLAIKNTEKGEVLSQSMSRKGSVQSEKSYADAFANACKTYPYQSDVNEVVEESFALVGLITKVEPDRKKAKNAGVVHIDLGKNHGVRKNQWFDVFIVSNGNVSDRIATLHLDKAEATTSTCKVKKGKKELLALWNSQSDVKFAVVSRMESNIWKKLEKALDFVTNIIDNY